MLKIYAETTTKAQVILKNDKIENHLESVEHILTAVGNITGTKAWKWAAQPGDKLVIELSMGDENTDKIKKEIPKETTIKCRFCDGEAVLTTVLKKVYRCMKCGAEGEHFVRIKMEKLES